MKKLLAYLKLVRLPNLLMIGAIQYMVRVAIIQPILINDGLQLQMSDFLFFIFVFSTILIAAAGYVINDYFDIRIDHINKPNKIVLGKLISRRKAILLHYVFNGIAIVCGFYVAYSVGSIKLGLFFPMIAVLMWYYSIRYKKMLLLGNFVIAFLGAFVVLVVWLFEFFALKTHGFSVVSGNQDLKNYLFGFAFFAFLLSLSREILKDIEDLEGDKRTGCHTLPVVAGVNISKIVIIFILLIDLVFLSFLVNYFFNLLILKNYLILNIVAIAGVIIFLIFSKQKKHFAIGSALLKILMILGILAPMFLSIIK